jgi:histidyl-tRNA synthetase
MYRKRRASDEDERVERAFEFIQGLHNLSGAPGEVLERARDFLKEFGLGHQPLSRLADVVAALSAYGIEDSHVQVQLALGRGLHYYTDVVFELYDATGQSQLCGGGRYNELVQSLGGRKSIPAVGFAFGLERLRLALEVQGAALPAPPQTQVLVAAVSSGATHASMQAAQWLREHGIRAEHDLRQRAVRARIGYANRRGIPFLLLVEDREETAVLRNLPEATEQSLSLEEVVQVLDG